MMSLILLAVGAAGAIASGTARGVQLSKEKNLLNDQLSDLETWYERNRSVDLLDDTEIKNTIREQSKIQKQRNTELLNTISKGSLTPEKEIALASNNNLNWGDQLAQVAKYDSQNKKNIENEYINNATNIYNSINGVNSGMVNNAFSTANSVIPFISNGVNMFNQSSYNKKNIDKSTNKESSQFSDQYFKKYTF